jgi:hypothetical protein
MGVETPIPPGTMRAAPDGTLPRRIRTGEEWFSRCINQNLPRRAPRGALRRVTIAKSKNVFLIVKIPESQFNTGSIKNMVIA